MDDDVASAAAPFLWFTIAKPMCDGGVPGLLRAVADAIEERGDRIEVMDMTFALDHDRASLTVYYYVLEAEDGER